MNTFLYTIRRCAPVSAQFHFLDYSTLKTSSKSQGSTIQWNDSRVLLLGISDPGRLLEYLRGPLFKIEVHDRDPKGTPLGKPSLFGTEEDDMVLGTTAFMAGKSLERNAFKGVEKPQAPYGVASFDLSPLLHGVTYLELTSPIQRSPRKSLQGSTHSESCDAIMFKEVHVMFVLSCPTTSKDYVPFLLIHTYFAYC